MTRMIPTVIAALAFIGCASVPRVTVVQPVPDAADVPYGNILVVSLFESFELRRYLETEIVKQLQSKGIQAVASTSKMNTRTPVTRATFRAMVDELGSDAVLLTQLASIETDVRKKNMRPEATYNFRPTYYYDVWSVELTEYREPPSVRLDHEVVLATQLVSVAQKEPVWAIEAKSRVVRDFDTVPDYSIIENEATAITRNLSRNGLIDH